MTTPLLEIRQLYKSYQKAQGIFGRKTIQALSDISFTVPAGKTVALVGRSGSGKTTISSLLPRFYELTSGDIFIDQHNIRSCTLASLRKQMALVSQHVTLFNDTIANNITYGCTEPVSEQQLQAVAEKAHVLEFAAHDQLLQANPAAQQVSEEEIVKLEREMSQVQEKYKRAEESYGSELLNLVVAKGYLKKVLENDAVRAYVGRNAPEMLEQFELVLNTVSMEEAVQQQAETIPADVSEASEP